jgi:hypothetical protein
VILAAGPLQPDRDLARSWANQELAKREYQAAKPSLPARLVSWIGRQFDQLNLGTGAPTLLGVLIVGLLVLTVVGYVLYRTGGLGRTARRPDGAVLPVNDTTAAQHRAAANRHAEAGEWDLAVVERFRALARELEERAVLSPNPGRTALEVARDGGLAVPDQQAELLAAARYFDDVSYGHLSLGPSADLALRALDQRLRAARLVAVQ